MNGTASESCLNSGCGFSCVEPQGHFHKDGKDTYLLTYLLIYSMVQSPS